MAKIDFQSLKGALGTLASEVRALRQRMEAIRREQEDVASAPPARGDVVAMLHVWVDGQAKQFDQQLKTMLGFALRRADACIDPARSKDIALLASTAKPDVAPNLKNADVAVCGLFGRQIKESLAEIVADMQWPGGTAGLPLEERLAKLSQLRTELDGLEAQESELVQEAAAAGVVLDSIGV